MCKSQAHMEHYIYRQYIVLMNYIHADVKVYLEVALLQ